jgi:hypothetical protein
MTDDTRFEDRLARALRDHADQAVLPFDAGEIADRAIDARPAAPAWIRLATVATLSVAAVVIIAVVAAQFVEGPVGIGDSRVIGADQLPGIVANASNTPGTWDQTLDDGGEAALNTPVRSGTVVELEGFVDGRTTEMCGTNEAGESIGCVLAWTALFGTVEEAETAYDFYVVEFEAPNGWNVPQTARSDPAGLGDEAVLYTNAVDPDTGFTMSGVYLWREENLLMGAVGVADMDVAAIRVIADAMQARAD